MQIQVNGGQGVQIQAAAPAAGGQGGLDASMLTQPLQIDSVLLNQLQGQGAGAASSSAGVAQSLPAADPNLVQNVQVTVAKYIMFDDTISMHVLS